MLTRPVADARIVGEVSALAFAGVLVAVLSLAENRVFAVGPEALPLWAEGAPHAKGSDESDTPTVRAYLPQELDGGKAPARES
jgi:hypothetical protein